MIKLYTEEEFNNAKSDDKLPLQCEYCGETFYVQKKIIKTTEKSNQKNRNRFCSRLCRNLFYGKTHKLLCDNCGKEFMKINKEYKKSTKHFCSLSCAATYNNMHKTHGNRRSKLEEYLENTLINIFPNVDFMFNDKIAIQSELDIYIPSLKLAFELNGIFHYEPIYGNEKLQKIITNDNNKFQKCQEKGISLCVIDTSSQKHFTEKSSKKFLEIITNIINENLNHLTI